MLTEREKGAFFDLLTDYWPGAIAKGSGPKSLQLWDDALKSATLTMALEALKQIKLNETMVRAPAMGTFRAALRDVMRSSGHLNTTSAPPAGPTETWSEFVASGGVEQVIARLDKKGVDSAWLRKNLPRWKAGAKLVRPVAEAWRSPMQAKDRPRDYMPPPVETDEVPF